MDDDQFLLQVLASIDEAEVLSIFFPLLRRALVVDTRHTAHIGPLIAVAPQVSSTAERIAWVAAARPDFGRPEFIMMLPWIKSIRSLTNNKPIYDAAAARTLVDRSGRPLALDRAFTADEPLEEMAHYLATMGYLHIRKTFLLQCIQKLFGNIVQGIPAQFNLQVYNFLYLVQEPAVYLSCLSY